LRTGQYTLRSFRSRTHSHHTFSTHTCTIRCFRIETYPLTKVRRSLIFSNTHTHTSPPPRTHRPRSSHPIPQSSNTRPRPAHHLSRWHGTAWKTHLVASCQVQAVVCGVFQNTHYRQHHHHRSCNPCKPLLSLHTAIHPFHQSCVCKMAKAHSLRTMSGPALTCSHEHEVTSLALSGPNIRAHSITRPFDHGVTLWGLLLLFPSTLRLLCYIFRFLGLSLNRLAVGFY
jgi:hypothetical protein